MIGNDSIGILLVHIDPWLLMGLSDIMSKLTYHSKSSPIISIPIINSIDSPYPTMLIQPNQSNHWIYVANLGWIILGLIVPIGNLVLFHYWYQIGISSIVIPIQNNLVFPIEFSWMHWYTSIYLQCY